MDRQAQVVEQVAYKRYRRAASAEVRAHKRILPAAEDPSQNFAKIIAAWERAMESRKTAWDEYMVAAEAGRA